MTDSRFWRMIAVGVVAGLFYVGAGLRNGTGAALPELTRAAQAEGVSTVGYSDNHSLIVTSSADGTTIYVWDAAGYIGGSQVRYLGTFEARE